MSRWLRRLVFTLSVLLLLSGSALVHARKPAPARPARPHPSGLRVYENGRNRRAGSAEILSLERALGNGHQPWRTEPLEVARVFTSNLLPGKPGQWRPISKALAPEVAGRYTSDVIALENQDLDTAVYSFLRPGTPSSIRLDLSHPRTSYIITLCRPGKSAWWVTGVRRVR